MPRTKPDGSLDSEVQEEMNNSSINTPSSPALEVPEASQGALGKEVAPEPAQNTNNSVVLSKEDFESLTGRLAALESKANLEVKEPQKKGEYRQVKVRFIEGEVVVGYGKSWEEKQIDGDKKLVLEVFTGGTDGQASEKKRHLVKFVEFHEEGDFEVADIIKVHEKYDEKSYGKVAKSKLTKDEWNMEETGEFVDSVVRIPNFIYELRLADGRTFALHQSALN